MTARSDSGSSRSASAVDPATSEKTTETVLRTSPSSLPSLTSGTSGRYRTEPPRRPRDTWPLRGDGSAPRRIADAVAEVGDVGALDDRDGALQLHRDAPELAEVGGAAAEQDGDQVDPDLIQQAGVQALGGDGAAVDPHHLVAGQGLGPLDRGLDAVGDEARRARRRGASPRAAGG